MGETIQTKFLVEQVIDQETLKTLEFEREELVGELVTNFSDSITGGHVFDFHRVAKTLGISNQLTDHIQKKVWNKLDWGDKTIYTGGGFNLAHFLLLNGDANVFSTVCSSEEELIVRGLRSRDIAELLAAYANSGREKEVLSFIQTSEINRNQDFWLVLFSSLQPNDCPELTSFVFKNLDKTNLVIEFKNNEAFIFLIRAENTEALNILQNTIDQLDDEESKTLFLHMLVKSSSEKFNLQLFEILIKIIEKGNFRHDDYELTFYFLEKIIMKMGNDNSLKDRIFSWVSSHDWQNSEIKRFAFSLMYSYHQGDKEICEEFEKGMREWFRSSAINSDPQKVVFWSILVAKLGLNHQFLQELFSGFKEDEGAFGEQWSEGNLAELSKSLLTQGMFKEIQQILAEKVSHRDSATYLSERFAKSSDSFEIDTYDERAILGMSDSVYDPVWTKKSLAETKRRLAEYIEKVKSLARSKPLYLRKLYKVALDSFGLLSPRILDVFSGKNIFIDMKKTGSALYILTGKSLGVLVNEVPSGSLTSWEVVHNAGIPVAPIIKAEEKFSSRVILDHDRSEGSKELRRVYSRYCGLNVLEYLFIDNDPQTILAIQEDMDKIKEQLQLLGIEHGHPHIQNFTVEFWRKEVLVEAEKNGININQVVPVNVGDLTFDISEVKKNPDNWIRIVRLIDWDNSSSKEK